MTSGHELLCDAAKEYRYISAYMKAARTAWKVIVKQNEYIKSKKPTTEEKG